MAAAWILTFRFRFYLHIMYEILLTI